MKFFIVFASILAAAIAQMPYQYGAQFSAEAELGSSSYGAAPSYSAPAPSYSAPGEFLTVFSHSKINCLFLTAPSYSAPSYSAPSYSAKPSYAPSYAGPATSYTYPSPAPPVPCPTNLLFSCSPNVAPVPCQAVSYQPAYKAPSYSAPSYSKPSY